MVARIILNAGILKKEVNIMMENAETLYQKNDLYCIEIINDNNKILYKSDNIDEIIAIEQYFEKIWITKRVKNEKLSDKYLCIIESIRVYNKDFLNNIEWQKKDQIFYDLQDGYWCEKNNRKYLKRNSTESFIYWDEKMKNIQYLRFNDEIENVFISQLIKDSIGVHKIKSGKLLLHSSAVRYKNKVFLFPANKGAGKSTLMMYFMNEGAEYLGNDSDWIVVDENNLRIEKNPHCIRLGKETVQFNDKISTVFNNEDFIEAGKMYKSSILSNEKYQIIPSALTKIYGENAIASDNYKIDYVIFPQLKLGSDNVEMMQMDNEMIQERLKQCFAENDHRECWLPQFNYEEIKQKTLNNMDEILKRINSTQCFSLNYCDNIDKTIGCIVDFLKI